MGVVYEERYRYLMADSTVYLCDSCWRTVIVMAIFHPEESGVASVLRSKRVLNIIISNHVLIAMSFKRDCRTVTNVLSMFVM